ncbi:MAG: hypothetical protein ACRDF7_08825 [Candidatus Limnocylindrales bacterium]
MWIASVLVAFLNVFGDCFRSEAECAALDVEITQRLRVLLAILVVNTIFGIAAAVRDRAFWHRLLALAAGMTAALAILSYIDPSPPNPIPVALFLEFPGSAALLLTALGALRRTRRPR